MEAKKAVKNIVPDESPILAEAADDFIPIEDLPTEKIELPSELIGKFEATKAETPATPTPAVAPAELQPQQPQRHASVPVTTTTHIIITTIITVPAGYNQQRPVQQRPAQPYNNGENYPAAPTQTRNRTRESVRIRRHPHRNRCTGNHAGWLRLPPFLRLQLFVLTGRYLRITITNQIVRPENR